MPPTTNYSRGGSHAADGQAWEPDLLENLVRNVLDWVLYPAQLLLRSM